MKLSAVILAAVVTVACTGSPGADTPGGASPGDDGVLPSGARYTPPAIEPVTEAPDGWLEAACELPVEHVRRIRRGYYPGRSPELVLVPREPNFIGNPVTTSHSGPWDYLQRVPLVLYGPGFIRSTGTLELGREVTLADLTPTLAALVGLDWPRGPGRALTEALVPARRRPGPPRLVLVIVWDGGGWNVLDAWPGTWPNLERLASEGTSVADAIVGSSPSVTPSIHTTIGTGAFPNRHGITGIQLREPGGDVVSSFPSGAGGFIEVPTLADRFDVASGNEANVAMIGFRSWHLGMIGRGADYPGGDRDIGVRVALTEELITNENVYSLPEHLHRVRGFAEDMRRVDLDDGKLDGRWMGHDILRDPRARRDTPVWTLYQTRLLKDLVTRQSFGADAVTDLFYTNYKPIDEAGHNWNMLGPEMPEEIRYSDEVLGDLVGFLDEEVGRKRWVVVVTADHGQAPDPDVSGAWPIATVPFSNAITERFGAELVENNSPVGVFLDRTTMQARGITLGAVADFATRYRLQDNLATGQALPPAYADRAEELVFAAAFPGDAMERVWRCVRR